jgi:hypothetical protein
MIDIIDRGIISLSEVKCLILDEADRMLDMGFEPQIREIVQFRDMPGKEDRQTLMFSATFKPDIQKLASEFLVEYVWIGVGRVGSTVENIKQSIVLSTPDSNVKLQLTVDAINSVPGRTLIFVQMKRTAAWLSDVLRNEYQIRVDDIHSDKSQVQREASLRRFRDGQVRVLVGTDVAARGLDIPDVSHVIQYDLPHTPDEFDSYVHRVGRTGRAGHVGQATSLFVPGTDAGGNSRIAPLILRLLEETEQVNLLSPHYAHSLFLFPLILLFRRKSLSGSAPWLNRECRVAVEVIPEGERLGAMGEETEAVVGAGEVSTIAVEMAAMASAPNNTMPIKVTATVRITQALLLRWVPMRTTTTAPGMLVTIDTRPMLLLRWKELCHNITNLYLVLLLWSTVLLLAMVVVVLPPLRPAEELIKAMLPLCLFLCHHRDLIYSNLPLLPLRPTLPLRPPSQLLLQLETLERRLFLLSILTPRNKAQLQLNERISNEVMSLTIRPTLIESTPATLRERLSTTATGFTLLNCFSSNP